MKVFLSWSGERSRILASHLRDWMPNVIQALEPWMSAEDISKGAPWLQQIRESLTQAKGIGVFCVTPENIDSPWLNFEAGFLASCDAARVCVVTLDIAPVDLRAPLNLFQATSANAQDFKKLLESLNAQTERPLTQAVLDKAFNTHWPTINQAFEKTVAQKPDQPKAKKRTADEMLHELIEISRRIEGSISPMNPSVERMNSALSSSVKRERHFVSRPRTSMIDLLQSDPTNLNKAQRERLIEFAKNALITDLTLTDFDQKVVRKKMMDLIIGDIPVPPDQN